MTVVAVSAIQIQDAKNPLTPAEVVANWRHDHLGPSATDVVVKLRVKVVAQSNPQKAFLYADADLPERVDFAVEVSDDAKTALERIGVVDLAEHFTGKEVVVGGRITMTTIWCFPSRDLYSIRVESLDQFVAVRD
jgi:hypothetical protein